MAQQLADNWQAKSTTCAEACIGVAKIMKADAVEPGTPRYSLPRTFQIGARLLGVVARHDVRAEPIEPGEDRKGRSISLSIKAKDIHEEQEAMQNYRTDAPTGTSLGDLLKEHISGQD